MLNPVAAERLIHEIVIERITGKTQSASGEITPVWTAVETRFAEMKPIRGRNVDIQAARTKGRAMSDQITMRYEEGDIMDPATTRIVFRGKRYEIFQPVNVLNMDVEWDILANCVED